MNRVDYLLQHVNVGDRVLHIGCCGDDDGFDMEWETGVALHKRLSDVVGNKLVGVDVNDRRVKKLQGRGFDVTVGDAQVLPASLGLFDVVVAGELIEHLENPGLFLSGVQDVLRPGGRLILTTPNVLGALFWLKYGVFCCPDPWPEHVIYFSRPSIVRLLVRMGFSDVSVAYCYYAIRRRIWKRIVYWFLPHLQDTLVVTCKRGS